MHTIRRCGRRECNRMTESETSDIVVEKLLGYLVSSLVGITESHLTPLCTYSSVGRASRWYRGGRQIVPDWVLHFL